MDGEEQREAQLCKTSFNVMSVSRATPTGLRARLSTDAALILSSLSVYLTDFYPNPFLSLPNHLSLFAYLHLPAHCYSLLPATPSQVHCAMFLWRSFHFFISCIHFSCRIQRPPSHFKMIGQIYLQKNLCSTVCNFMRYVK